VCAQGVASQAARHGFIIRSDARVRIAAVQERHSSTDARRPRQLSPPGPLSSARTLEFALFHLALSCGTYAPLARLAAASSALKSAARASSFNGRISGSGVRTVSVKIFQCRLASSKRPMRA
jgi:hypothetical protein